MAIKGKTPEESQAIAASDAQIRRLNAMLKKAADTFGIQSRMYKEREARAIAAVRLAGGEYTGGSEQSSPSILQVRRTAKTVKSFARKGSHQHRMLAYIVQSERVQSIEDIRNKMLQQYVERQQAPILEMIESRKKERARMKELGKDVREIDKEIKELEKQMRSADPSYVDPSIKGRKARSEARKRQLEQAIREQAQYYTDLNKNITEALALLYEEEKKIGQWTQVHSDATKLNPIRATLKEREDLLKRLLEELRNKDKRITEEFESGLAGSILGVGGGGGGGLS